MESARVWASFFVPVKIIDRHCFSSDGSSSVMMYFCEWMKFDSKLMP